MIDIRIERLKKLPQHPHDVWQGGALQMPTWVSDAEGNPIRLAMACWISTETEKTGISKGNCPMDETGFGMVLDALADFATGEYAGYRPGSIEVLDAALADYLSERLAEAGIRVDLRSELPVLDFLKKDLGDFLLESQPQLPGYLDAQGVEIERVEAFADAAKLFFEAAPWRHLSNEDPIAIASPNTDGAFRIALVMGNGGIEYGLAFYRSLQDFWEARSPTLFHRKTETPDGVWSLMYDTIDTLPVADANLWDDHRLPVAAPNAYPMAINFSTKSRVRRPGATTLTFFEGLMRALAATTEAEMDSGRWTKRVEAFDGPADFTLSLPLLLDPPNHTDLYEQGILDHRTFEASHAQMQRFAAAHDFDNLDDLNEAIVKEFRGKPYDPEKYKPQTLIGKAQELCYQAFDSAGRRKVVLARQALELCPDCADAYVILAEFDPNIQRKLELYAAGVEAGRRALGPEFFEQHAGGFWEQLPSRPFMRALFGLADAQDATGQIGEAIASYRELLRLNPYDNQGARYLLLPLLIASQRFEEAETLLSDYAEDGMATWPYCNALLAFARQGDSIEARRRLRKAFAVNPYAAPYLTGKKESGGLPEHFGIGSEEEGEACAEECGFAWYAIPGAIDWLKARASKIAPRRKKPHRPKKKTRRPKKR